LRVGPEWQNGLWRQNGDRIALRCVDGLLAGREENRSMASLEQFGRTFRMIFRYNGIKYARALSTRNEKASQATSVRLEGNLHP
jgi:hypothetical protein